MRAAEHTQTLIETSHYVNETLFNQVTQKEELHSRVGNKFKGMFSMKPAVNKEPSSVAPSILPAYLRPASLEQGSLT